MSESSSGHQQWKDWFFDFGVFGTEGLCLVDGFFRGHRMFNKLSLPVIRVKYVKDEGWGGATAVLGTGCGPYNDQITWDLPDFGEDLNFVSGPHHLVKVAGPSGDRYIYREAETISGTEFFRLGVYARIGAYHIFQSWMLDNDGGVRATVFSKGLSCNLDHWHHPYWRFDLSMGLIETHRVSVRPKGGGAKIADITIEQPLVNSFFGRDVEYEVTSTQPPMIGFIERPARCVITPPTLNDVEGIVGPAPFSGIDGYVRTFKPEEDRPWPHKPQEEMAFANDDFCQDRDIVFWSVCHLFHRADEGKDHWHSVGPVLRFEPMIVAGIPAECMRVVEVSGEIHVKNFALVGKDEWTHVTYNEKREVNPNQPSAEVVVPAQVGDVTVQVIIRLTWNPDSSVRLQYTCNLFDEAERVSQVSNQFFVLRDAQINVSGIHLVDYHKGDPDTADVTIKVDNRQK